MFRLSSVPIARTTFTTFDDRVVAADFSSLPKLFPSMLTSSSFTLSIAYIINTKLLNKHDDKPSAPYCPNIGQKGQDKRNKQPGGAKIVCVNGFVSGLEFL